MTNLDDYNWVSNHYTPVDRLNILCGARNIFFVLVIDTK